MAFTINKTDKNLWMAFPVAVAVLFTAMILTLYIPLGKNTISEGKRLYTHFQKKRDAKLYPRQKMELNRQIALLDSVMQKFEARNQRKEALLVDALYTYADSAEFKTEKMEVGVPQKTGTHYETAVSIDGSGEYRAVGTFVGKIENSSQSTRIRQLIIKRKENNETDVFIDLVIREEEKR